MLFCCKRGSAPILCPILPWLLAAGLATLFLSGCASSSLEEEVLAAQRPDHCKLVEVGPVRIARSRLGRPTLREKARARGYDRITDVRAIVETYRTSSGTLQEYVVGWDAIAWRWNDPACRLRR